MKILLAGGGTMGSVAPLLAVVPELQERGHAIVFVGTVNGPEQSVVEAMELPFFALHAAKLRRYLTWRHLLIPFEFKWSLWQAYRVLRSERPDVIVSAGGFIAVPVIIIGRLLGVPSVIHQQDARPTMSNVVCARFATVITTTFEESVEQFKKFKTPQRVIEWIGNPVRDLSVQTNAIAPLLDTTVPTVLVMGGGTGATGINELIDESLCEIANVIHVTGKGKRSEAVNHPRYHAFEFLNTELFEALSLATVVVSRCGLSSLTELSALSKPTIFIPMPDSHQDDNADLITKHTAGLVLSQGELIPGALTAQVDLLLGDAALQKTFGANLHAIMKSGANKRFVELIERV